MSNHRSLPSLLRPSHSDSIDRTVILSFGKTLTSLGLTAMVSMQKFLLTIVSLAASLCPVLDRPPLKPERLLAISSDAIVGTVVRVYTHEETTKNYKTTLCIAEIAVEEVVKGDEIQPTDRVYVKYYYTKWIGDGPMAPGWNGQRGRKAGSRIKVYLRGSKDSGFNVVEPNGFASFPKPADLDEKGWEVLQRRSRKMYRSDSYFNRFIESLEVQRVLVVQNLIKSIEADLGKFEANDDTLRLDLKLRIDDLDHLDPGELDEKIEGFRKQMNEISASSE